MKTQTVRERYGEDHHRLDKLFHRFQGLRGTDLLQAGRLFAEFKAGLERHIVWEEECLFPRFERRFGHLTEGPTEVMRWEHRHLRQYLARIEQSLARQDAEVELEQIAFLSLLCAHNQKEEGVLYPMIDDILGEDDRCNLFAEMERTEGPRRHL